MGEEDDTVDGCAADLRARVAAAASKGGEGRGHERRAGWLLGLREFVGQPTCGRAHAGKTGKVGRSVGLPG